MRLALAPAVVPALFLAACGGSQTNPKAAAPAVPIAVQSAAVARQSWPEVYQAAGTVRARTAVVLSSKVMAYVRQVNAQVGDRVHEGQQVIALDSQDLESNLRRAEAAEAEVRASMTEADSGVSAAKANLDLAQITYTRMNDLAAQKSISPQELDQASAHWKAAVAAHDMARAKRTQLDSRLAQVRQEIRAARILRDYATISAPFAGVVTARNVEAGNLAAPGAPLLTIEREGAYRLEASVDESRLPIVKAGQSVDVVLEALDRHLIARVSEIVPAVDAASRSYTVKIDLPSLPGLRSGMFGRAGFSLGARSVLAVPASALVERGQLQSVFVIEDGIARNRLVTTGGRDALALEVLSGLSEGEKVVTPIPPGLADGARVEARP